jgi:hypothetical protein
MDGSCGLALVAKETQGRKESLWLSRGFLCAQSLMGFAGHLAAFYVNHHNWYYSHFNP